MIYLLFAVSIALHILTLKDGHNWGGDFGQYIIHAQNLLRHKDYTQGIMLEKAIVYPPGFPLLVAPFIKIFGINFKVLKSINIACWYGALFFLYLIFKNHRGNVLLAIALLAASAFFFVFKQNVLSDIPFTFLAVAAVWALEKKHLGLALALIFAAVMTRSAGLILSASAIFYFAAIKKDFKIPLAVIAASGFAVAAQALLTGGMHPAFWRTLWSSPLDVLMRLAHGASTVWQSMVWFYCPGYVPATSFVFTALEAIAIICSPLLYLGVVYIFIKKIRANNLSFIECFCFFYLGMLFIWASFGDSPQNFTRLALPIVGFIVMLAMGLAERLNKSMWLKWALVGLIAANVVNIAAIFRFNDDEIAHYRPNQELFAWIKEHAAPDEHFMLWEPRTITLMTGRVGTTVAWLQFNPPQQWQNMARQWNVRYIILNPAGDQEIIARLQTQPWAKRVWHNDGYVVFEALK